MTSRPGLTLIEVLVAIVIAGVVALLVYGTAQIGIDVRQRLADRAAADHAWRATRVLLIDALRNARPPAFFGDSVFTLHAGRRPGGRPADRLSFRTAGGVPPLTSDSDWLLTLEATDSGATVSAQRAGTRLAPRVVAHLPDVVGVEVSARGERAGRAAWVRAWPNRAALPAAVSVTFWTARGPAEPPLIVPLPNATVYGSVP